MVIIPAEDEMESRERAHLAGIHSIGHKDGRQGAGVGHRCEDFGFKGRLRYEAGARQMLVALTDLKQKIGARDLTDSLFFCYEAGTTTSYSQPYLRQK